MNCRLSHRNAVFSLCLSAFMLVFGVLSVHALPVTEKVGKVFHLGSPVDLDGKEFMVTGEIVALSEKIKMQSGDIQIISPSIFFVIDHSGSMYNEPNGRDSLGFRFTVTDKIIEMLANNPTEYPGVECGLSIFGTGLYYEGTTDPLVLDTLPDSLNTDNTLRSGGYLPLFTLDQDYDTKDGSMKGAAILRKYLETEFDTNPSTGYRYRKPTAPEDNTMAGNTNISLGFRAAINALKATTNSRDNHYIIFISDGQSTAGWDDYENGFVLDVDYSDTNFIATTFTIFFPLDTNGSHPTEMDNMNTGIKNNGYSKSNIEYTQLWDFMNSTEDELLQFVKDSIISVIIKKQVWKNLQIDGVNGLGVWNEQDQVFDLPSVIPLTGVTTPFHYNITYEIDTVFRQNDIDTIKIDFEITIDHNLTQNDTIFEVTHWERTLGFYDASGNGLDSIHGAVDQLTLKFMNDSLTSGYTYSEAKVEVRTVNGGDVETYTLQENSFQNFMTVVQPVAVTGLATPGDGKLEYKLHDTFILTFRNSESAKLPLDTLTTSIKINSDILEMTRGIYFDNDANGEIDSIFVEILGDCNFTADDVTLIGNKIMLPAHREFTLQNTVGLDNGVGLLVTQKSAINTAVNNNDTLNIKETIVLSDNGTINKGTVSVIDSVAAVIMKASLVDYIDGSGDDILTITFSENIEEPEKEEPFSFYATKDDNVYSAKLTLTDINGARCKFEVISVNGASFIEEGDSIRINWKIGENIVDLAANNQDHPENIRREIEVKAITTILRSVYYDDAADGHVDRMTVTLPEYDYSTEAIEKIVNVISFPDYRLMILNKYEENNSVITLSVSDTTNTITISQTDICYTSCNINDKLVIPDEVHLSGSFYLSACSVDIIDSVAPVILSAAFVDYLKPDGHDTLTVVFSEPVENITQEIPFKLYKTRNQKEYEAKLSLLSQSNITAYFEVLSLSDGMPKIDIGDSIRIHKDGEVFDIKKNEQDNPKNVRREIAVKRIPIAQDVDVNSTIKFITDMNLKITVTPVDNDMVTEYDSLAAVFNIYDAVGNTVRSDLVMEFKQDGDNIYLYYEWDCRNHFGRIAGGGSYLGVFDIDFIYIDKENNNEKTILNNYVKYEYLSIQK